MLTALILSNLHVFFLCDISISEINTPDTCLLTLPFYFIAEPDLCIIVLKNAQISKHSCTFLSVNSVATTRRCQGRETRESDWSIYRPEKTRGGSDDFWADFRFQPEESSCSVNHQLFEYTPGISS